MVEDGAETQDNKTDEAPPVIEPAPTWVESTTLEFPKGLPMEFVYDHPTFYARECYPAYYTNILGLLSRRTTEAVTVTGTPGKYFILLYFI